MITLDPLGEVDSINSAGLKILKRDREIIGNHYMYLFEKDEEDLVEIITTSEIENETKSELNMPLIPFRKIRLLMFPYRQD